MKGSFWFLMKIRFILYNFRLTGTRCCRPFLVTTRTFCPRKVIVGCKNKEWWIIFLWWICRLFFIHLRFVRMCVSYVHYVKKASVFRKKLQILFIWHTSSSGFSFFFLFLSSFLPILTCLEKNVKTTVILPNFDSGIL